MANPKIESIYRYIRLFQISYPGRSPSYREIGEVFNLSTSMVSYYLKQLFEEGFLVIHGEGQSRSFSVEGYFLTVSDLEKLGISVEDVRMLQERTKSELQGVVERGRLDG